MSLGKEVWRGRLSVCRHRAAHAEPGPSRESREVCHAPAPHHGSGPAGGLTPAAGAVAVQAKRPARRGSERLCRATNGDLATMRRALGPLGLFGESVPDVKCMPHGSRPPCPVDSPTRWQFQLTSIRPLHVDLRPGSQPTAAFERTRRLGPEIGVEWRIEKDHIEAACRAAQKRIRITANDVRAFHSQAADRRAQQCRELRITLDEYRGCGASRQGFDGQSPTAGEEIKATCAFDSWRQPVEQRLAYTIRRRAKTGPVWHVEPGPA